MSSNANTGGIVAITGQIDYSNAYHVFPSQLQPIRSTIITYGTSLMSVFIGFPLDTIKTRMQTHKNFTSYYDCIRKSYNAEGIRGFFRGIWAPLISSSIMRSISVSVFSSVKPYTYSMMYQFTDPSKPTEHPFIRNIPVCMVSGMIAGGTTSMLACPFEFTKVYAQIFRLVQNKSLVDIPKNLQTMNQEYSPSTVQIARQIIKYDGVLGLYSGLRYHFIRDCIGSGIYFSVYESMKYVMNQIINKDPTKSSQFSILLSGGLSGIFGWMIVFPVDTTKSLIQKDAVANILRKQQGLEPFPPKSRKIEKLDKRLFRGLGMSMTRTFITNMVFFSAYEFAMSHLI